MKHVVQIQVSGTRDGQEWPPVGERIDLPPDEAAHYEANGTVGKAEPAAAPPSAARPVPETATAPKPETRSRRKTGG